MPVARKRSKSGGVIGLYGLGLMGSSLGLALKKERSTSTIVGWDSSSKSRVLARKKKAIDRSATGPAGLGPSDIVVFSVPPSAVPGCLRKIRPHLKPKTILMDLSSVRGRNQAQAMNILGPHAKYYVGAHPIAGSEKSGTVSSKADLYRGAVVLLVEPLNPAPGLMAGCRKFWKNLGCRTLDLKAKNHDLLVAYTSHLPHVIASSLRHSVLSKKIGQTPVSRAVGPGFRDSTRIALAKPDLWADILWENRKPVLEAIQDFERSLSRYKKALRKSGQNGSQVLRRYLEQGKKN